MVHMQRNNAKDDAVEGGENGERPPSSQPIAPAVAGQASPQPAEKSIPKYAHPWRAYFEGAEKRCRWRTAGRRLSKAMRHVYREIRDSGLLKRRKRV